MHRRPSAIDQDLRAIATSQLGLITSQQAHAASVSAQSMSFRRFSGLAVTQFRGVDSLDGQVHPLQRLLAAALAVEGAVIAGPSAGLIHGFPGSSRWVEPTMPVVLNVPSKRVVRLPGIVTVRSSVPLPSRPWMSVRVASPAAALLLLPKFVDAATVQRCLDHCLVERLASVAAIEALIDAQPYRAVTGRALLLELLAARRETGGHRSGVEQRVAGWLNAAGMRGWRANHRVPVARGVEIELDFAWVEPKVALEVSPFYTHGSEAKQARDMVRRRQLVAAGWKVVEATDADLVDRTSFARIVELVRQLVREFPPSGSSRTIRQREPQRPRQPDGSRVPRSTAAPG